MKRDDSCVGGACLSGLHGNDIDDRTSRKQRGDEVDAVGNCAEGGVEDGLSNPYNECEVDEYVDDRCEGDDHPHKNIEEVIPVAHFLQLPPFLLPALDNSDGIVHFLIIYNINYSTLNSKRN